MSRTFLVSSLVLIAAFFLAIIHFVHPHQKVHAQAEHTEKPKKVWVNSSFTGFVEVEYDGCQYLLTYGGNHLAHKANCSNFNHLPQ